MGFCNGQLLPIAQNTALFSFSTTYGGDGMTTFALPDLGKSTSRIWAGPSLSNRVIGEIWFRNSNH